MQTTLLGLAIAFIIALVAALVGPSFIDWNQYRPQFEAEASRVVGAPVRVEGSLDARLLPAPILRLRSLSVGAPVDATKMHADKLDVEFSLGSLMRGEWRATQLSLANVALDIGLDARGGVIAPSKGAFNFGALAIDRLDLNGSVKVHDGASGADYALDNIAFSGDVRSLGTNMRGEGTIGPAGSKQPFRIAISQTPDNNGTRVRLDLDPAKEGALAASLDGTLTFDQRAPRFEGMTTLARQASRPWHLSAKAKANPSGASFEQAELVYGPDDTGLKFGGGGELSFGKTPRLRASLTADQLDGDRLLTGDAAGQNLIDLLRSAFASAPAAPLASQIEVSVDRLVLAGKQVANLRAVLRGSPEAWAVEKFTCLAPGVTTISASGVAKGSTGNFAGPLKIDSRAGRTFFDWVYRRAADFRASDTPVQIAAMANIGKDSLSLDNIKGDLSGSVVEGSLVLNGRSLKLTLASPSFDFADLEALTDLASVSLPTNAQVALNFAEAKLDGRSVRPFVIDASYKAQEAPSLSKASLDLNVRRADLTPWLGSPQVVSGLTGRLSIADNKFTLEKLDAKLGGQPIKGSLSLTRGNDTYDFGGAIMLDRIEAAPLLALALGASGHDKDAPLGQGWFGSRGSLAFTASMLALPGGLQLSDASGALRADGSSLSLDNLKATLGKGAVTGSVQAKRVLSGTTVNADIKVTDVEGAALKYRTLVLPAARASLQMTLASSGRSAAALADAVSGSGVLTMTDARLPSLNPAVFDAALQASEASQKTDVRQIALTTLEQAPLAVPSLQVPFSISDSRLHTDPVTAESGNIRATISGGYDVPADQLDIRAVLRSAALKPSPPDIQIFAHGTPDSLERDVDTSLLTSWLSLREIERETKRLDEMEKNTRPPSMPASAPASVPLPQNPAGVVSTPSQAPAAVPPKDKPAPKPPVVRNTPAVPPNVTASGQRVAPLPPPINIRPAPGSPQPRKPLPPPGATF